VSIVGDGTIGLHREKPIKHDCWDCAVENYGAAAAHSVKGRALNNSPYSSTHTSNDLLFSLDSERSRQSLNYEIVTQSAGEVQDIQNAPAVSMGPYLIESGQTQLLTTISIYSQRGESREQIRLLYMNAVALRVWEAMGKRPSLIGAQHRPPRNALLAFGVPFSE
jgi:hypothetical protein